MSSATGFRHDCWDKSSRDPCRAKVPGGFSSRNLKQVFMANPLSHDDRNNTAAPASAPPAEGTRSPRCPLVDHPLAECYCVVLTSLKIPNVIAYCQGDYENCETYQQWRRTQEPPAVPVETPAAVKQEQHAPRIKNQAASRGNGRRNRKKRSS